MEHLPSANFFQKSMSYYVLRDVPYQTCEVYIDDFLVYGASEDNFVNNLRHILTYNELSWIL
jgi:hypothetical protein